MGDPRFTVAMAQMLVEGGQPEGNMARAVEMICRSASDGAAVVVLPEAFDVGWTHPSARELAEDIPGPRSEALAVAAIAANVHVVAGLTERAGERIYNASVLISPAGEILLKHRKINILDIAQDLYSIGDRLAVAETPLGTIGITICADNFSASLALGHSLARMGAQMILSPCAWAMPAEHDNDDEPYGQTWLGAYGELARLYDMYVIGVSNVGWISGGPWDGRKCIGRSLAVGPGGEVAAHLPYGVDAEALVSVEVATKQPAAVGTAIAGMLKGKGYQGP